MKKLSFTHKFSHVNVINTVYDDIIEDKVFSGERIRIYNNILSNKLDNDDIDNNNNDVNTNHLVSNERKSLKRKCNDDVYNKHNELNTIKVPPIERKSRKINILMCEKINNKKNTKIINDIMIEKDHLNFKLNDKKRLVYLPRRLQ